MNKLKYIVYSLVVLQTLKGLAQDAQLSQIYGLPLYLNPAYTGNTQTHRACLKYRNQWPDINKAYTTMAASYDFNNVKLHSGFGLMYIRESAGVTALINNNVRLLYAYNLQLTRTQTIRMGLNVDYTRKEIDLSKLVFNDQLYTQSGQTFEQIYSSKVNYFDAGVGALYNLSNFWVGLSVNHLNKPSTSTIDRSSRLPMYWHANAGIKLIKNREYHEHTKYGILWASYRHQYNFNQLDIGGQFIMYNLTLGVSYRGIPIQKKRLMDRNDALSFTLGFGIPNLNMRFGYSYDLTISRLAMKSSGSHEITLVFEIKTSDNEHNRKKKMFAPEF